MRWDDLFDDLEAQWEAQARRELDAEVADRTRRERAAIGLRERLAGEREGDVRLALVDGGSVTGRVEDVGDGWLLVLSSGIPCLMPFSAVVAVAGLRQRAATPGLSRSFGFGYALRGLSRDRAVVSIQDLSGAVSIGTIDAVGRDLVELTEHPADLARRPENVTGRRVVPFVAVVAVRRL